MFLLPTHQHNLLTLPQKYPEPSYSSLLPSALLEWQFGLNSYHPAPRLLSSSDITPKYYPQFCPRLPASVLWRVTRHWYKQVSCTFNCLPQWLHHHFRTVVEPRLRHGHDEHSSVLPHMQMCSVPAVIKMQDYLWQIRSEKLLLSENVYTDAHRHK